MRGKLDDGQNREQDEISTSRLQDRFLAPSKQKGLIFNYYAGYISVTQRNVLVPASMDLFPRTFYFGGDNRCTATKSTQCPV